MGIILLVVSSGSLYASLAEVSVVHFFFFFKQKTAYEVRISDWIQTCALPIWSRPVQTGATPGEPGPMKRSASRRDVLRTAAASAAFSLLLGPVERALAASQGLEFGPAEPFSFDALVARARDRARSSYRPPYRPAPELVQQID